MTAAHRNPFFKNQYTRHHQGTFSTCRLLLYCILLLTIWSNGAAQLRSDSLQIDGTWRRYHYQEPSTAVPPQRLVFVLHGSGGSGIGRMKETATLQTIAATEPVLFVYPDGYKNFWNECRKAASSAANLEDIDEASFFRAMISALSKKYGADSSAAFAIGFSGGGHMAYKLALTMPETFRAIVAIVASLPAEENMDCTPSGRPAAVMIVNGTNDQVSPYNGGTINAAGVTLGQVRSTEATFRYWSSLAGYSGEPLRDLMPDADTTNSTSIERYRYAAPGKPEVTLLKMVNGTHADPKDLDIYREAWDFLKRQTPSLR
ncbi:MAG: poly(3-hydroxybutyrate) depolymerase [Bacteroidetes bacterium]|nr:poly(3-hydroxybutyrate) depolymerase [Bacteroidota bacterium]